MNLNNKKSKKKKLMRAMIKKKKIKMNLKDLQIPTKMVKKQINKLPKNISFPSIVEMIELVIMSFQKNLNVRALK